MADIMIYSLRETILYINSFIDLSKCHKAKVWPTIPKSIDEKKCCEPLINPQMYGKRKKLRLLRKSSQL